jgi:hypothetical protein
MQHTRLSGRLAAAIVLAAITSCGSSSVSSQPGTVRSTSSPAAPSSAAPTTTAAESTTVAVRPDGRLAAAALLEPADVGKGWGLVSENLIFPISADIARPLAACKSYAEIVFEGGSQHGAGKSGVISNSPNLVFLYTVVFPTVEQATAMIDAVASAGFDECWARFNEASILKMPLPVKNPKYEPKPPPSFTLTADASTVKHLVGSIEFSGSVVPDTCVCIFARVGRGVVSVHSAEETLTPEERVAVAQSAIDKMRRTLAAG